jgi:hypothetical protein
MTQAGKQRGNAPIAAQERLFDASVAVPPAASALLYLYGVAEAGTEGERLLASRAVPGLDPGEPLFPIAVDELVAAVSWVPGATFEEEPLNALLADLPRLAALAVQHEEAVRALLPVAPALVPMAFGTVYRGPERVAALLRERAGEFHELLALVRGKYEWGLKVYRETARWLATADATSDALRRLATAAAQASPGRAYLLSKQRDRLRAAEADRLAAEALDAIVGALEPLSAAARRNALGAAEPAATQLVLSAAFLVGAAAAEAFRAATAELERTYAPQGLSVEVSGPWAPYSFVGGGRGAA